MRPQWESQISMLDSALQQWEEMYPKLPATFTYQNAVFTVKELTTSLREIIGIVRAVSSCEDIDPVLLAVHQQNIINVCGQIPSAIVNSIASPQSYLEQLVGYIWSIRSSIVWLITPRLTEYYGNWVKNSDVYGKIEATEDLYKRISDSIELINNSISRANEADNTAKNILQVIQGYEREAANAKTNAESSSSLALTNKDNVQDLLSKLEAGQTKQQELFEKINSLHEAANDVLEGSSKVGLAASFAARRENLENSQKYWIGFFFFGIGILIIGIFLTTTGFINLVPLIKADGTMDSWGVLVRILLTGPAIWFTWFVARQYGHTMRLIEDYAFKEASALAFVGYKREMGEDLEMIKLLRETAIKNFGAAPTRMLSISEPSSPVHELVDKALQEKGGLEKVTEFLKTIVSSKNS
ncbi:MAG: hypothetical protein FJ190_02470 [Gammaproteobacteria bacterium]|nr:hypothetical protein [Gammaproteobacteria bacterium]